MTETSDKTVEIGVVLQGGGALGAYECGALTALLELMEHYTEQGHRVVLKVVTGVSIGAINAACVVGARDFADARRRLSELWDDLTLDPLPFWFANLQRQMSFFGVRGFFSPRSDYWRYSEWTYLYDTKPLLATLDKHVDFAALNTSSTAFVVVAVDVVSGQLQPFQNKLLQGVSPTEITPDHVLASGSLPPAFPWTKIGNICYWDGGLVENTPLSFAIDAFSVDPSIDCMLVVMNLYPLRARLPRNMAEVEDRVHELSFGNRARQDHDMTRRINALVATIEDLSHFVPPDELSDYLQARLDEARRYKIIDTILNIDMQNPAASLIPPEQNPSDDQDGMHDFSPETVSRRRHDGYKFARAILEPAFESRWQARSTAAPTRS